MKINKIKNWQILATFALVFLMCSNGYSQREQWYGAFTYSLSFPTGDTKNFVDEISWRGIGLDYRYAVQPNMTVGLNFGWNVFHEEKTGLNHLDTDPPADVYGTQESTINSFPIMASFHYYFGKRKSPRPYIGLSAGGFIMLQRYEIGIYLWDNDQWQWGIAPEAGVVIPLEGDYGVIINGKYNYAFTGESAIGNDINNAYFQVNVGIVWEP